MTSVQRASIRRWKLLGDRDHRELLQSLDRAVPESIAIYRELRRRSHESSLGYPNATSSSSGSPGSGHSDRVGSLAAALADGSYRDPVRDALLRLEACLFDIDVALRGAISQALALPELTVPKPATRDVCVDCGSSPIIVGELVGSRCRACRRNHRAQLESRRRRRLSGMGSD